MSLADRIFTFYVYSNLHVALAVGCLVKITLIESQSHGNNTAVLMACGTVMAYNLIRLVQINKIHDHLSVWIRTHKRSLITLNFLCLILAVSELVELHVDGLLILAPFSLVTILYVLPLDEGWSRGLRYVPGLKLFLIAFTWAGLTVLFPLVAEGLDYPDDILIRFFQRVLFIMAITIPFDIRDFNVDDGDLKTLPQLLGVKWAKIIGLICVILFAGLEWSIQGSSSGLYRNLILSTITALMIWGSSVGQSRFYTAFWIEALPVLWFVLVMFTGGS